MKRYTDANKMKTNAEVSNCFVDDGKPSRKLNSVEKVTMAEVELLLEGMHNKMNKIV